MKTPLAGRSPWCTLLLGTLASVVAATAIFAGAGTFTGSSAAAGVPPLALPSGTSALVQMVKGRAEWSAGSGGAWRVLRAGEVLPGGALIRTGPGTVLDLELAGETSLRVLGDASLTLGPAAGRLAPEPPSVSLLLGRVWVNLRRELSPGQRFTIETPAAVVGVRGTLFTVAAAPDGWTVAAVHRGRVEVSRTGADRALRLSPGEEARVGVGHAPEGPFPLSDREREAARAQRVWLEDAGTGDAAETGGSPGEGGGDKGGKVDDGPPDQPRAGAGGPG